MFAFFYIVAFFSVINTAIRAKSLPVDSNNVMAWLVRILTEDQENFADMANKPATPESCNLYQAIADVLKTVKKTIQKQMLNATKRRWLEKTQKFSINLGKFLQKCQLVNPLRRQLENIKKQERAKQNYLTYKQLMAPILR